MYDILRRAAVLVALVALIASSATVAVAQDANADPEWEQEVFDEFSGKVDQFNAQIGEVNLGPAGDRLAGTTANLYVEDGAETADISFRMNEQNQIVDLSRDPNPDADLKITTDRETVREIASANNPAAKFRSAYASGDITIEANYSLGDAVSGKQGDVVKSVTNWGFWKATGALKGLLG
jgi:hypothetical protein